MTGPHDSQDAGSSSHTLHYSLVHMGHNMDCTQHLIGKPLGLGKDDTLHLIDKDWLEWGEVHNLGIAVRKFLKSHQHFVADSTGHW